MVINGAGKLASEKNLFNCHCISQGSGFSMGSVSLLTKYGSEGFCLCIKCLLYLHKNGSQQTSFKKIILYPIEDKPDKACLVT